MRNLSAKKALMLLAALTIIVFLLPGCYTRIMMYQGEVTADGKSGESGGCGDCLAEVAPTGSREVCVWERDLFGYPHLRCYYTGYSSSWLYFHNTPWWYRSSYAWYDTRGCPPYYYYSRATGTCRYYGGSYPGSNNGLGGGGGGGGGGGAVGVRPQPPTRGVTPGAAAAASESGSASVGSPMFSGGASKTLSPVGAPSSQQPSASPSGSGTVGMSKPQVDQPAEQGSQGQRSAGEVGGRPQPPTRGVVKPQHQGDGAVQAPPPPPPPVVEQKAQEQKPNDQNERPRPSRGR